MRRLFNARLCEGRPPVTVPEDAGDVAQLKAEFPAWRFAEKWVTANSGPEGRTLSAWPMDGGPVVRASTADGLRARIREAAPAAPVTAYKITIWCESGLPEGDLAAFLERGELWDAATGVQYQIERVTQA
jgi:hypothetical protein